MLQVVLLSPSMSLMVQFVGFQTGSPSIFFLTRAMLQCRWIMLHTGPSELLLGLSRTPLGGDDRGAPKTTELGWSWPQKGDI